jgi:hypothetical protein
MPVVLGGSLRKDCEVDDVERQRNSLAIMLVR